MGRRGIHGGAAFNGENASGIVGIEMLDAKRCSELAETVLSLRHHWRDRGIFWTLGASTYLDDVMAYMGIAHQDNSILTRYFGALLQEIADLFQEIMNKPTIYLHSHALPGFHIFDHSANGKEGSIHIDEPYKKCFWPCGIADPFSFTMALELPGEGGLNLYKPDGVEYFPYEVGYIYIHDGMTIHQIANPVDMSKDQHRITLQGHGATLDNNQIVLYF